jgi:hypothetical protein
MEKKIKKVRQYRSNQGKSPEKIERTYSGCLYLAILMAVFVFGTIIYYMLT